MDSLPSEDPKRWSGRLAAWVVRRAGVARLTTYGFVLGLVVAAVAGPHVVAGECVLAVIVAGLIAQVALHGREDGSLRLSLLGVCCIILVGLAAGHVVGSLRVSALDRSELKGVEGSVITARLTVTGAVRASGSWYSAPARVEGLDGIGGGGGGGGGGGSGMADPARATGEAVLLEVKAAGTGSGNGAGEGGAASDGGVCPLFPGACLEVKARVVEPQGETESGFDQRAYLRNQGIQLVLQAQAADVKAVGVRGGVSGWFDRLRLAAQAHLSRGPDARLDEVLEGIVMGDTAGLETSWVEAFRRAGTAHMLSVSGLHVSSLAGLVIGLARLVQAPRGVGFALAGGACCLMVPFVGPSPPVVRAVVMILVALFGRWVGRGRDQWQILGLAAAVVLGLNPYALFDVGFQLSFSAFAAMVALMQPLRKVLRFLPDSIAENVAVSLAASLGTAPVSLAVFGRISLVSVFANLLVVPVLPVLTGLGMASVGAGFVWSGLSTALDWLVAPVSAWVVEVSRLFAQAPVLESDQLLRAVLAVGAGVAAIPVALAVTGRAGPRRLRLNFSPLKQVLLWIYVRRPRRRGVALAFAVVVLLGGVTGGWLLYPWAQRGLGDMTATVRGTWPDTLELRVLDVGQGTAVLVRTPAHQALLFDAGPAEAGLGRQLSSLGVRTLDLAVISHPHADHFAGLLECLGSVKVKTLVDRTEIVPAPEAAGGGSAGLGRGSGAGAEPGLGAGTASTTGSQEACDYLELRQQVEAQGGTHVLAHAGMLIEAGELQLRAYLPTDPVRMAEGKAPWALRSSPPSGDELNAGSLVLVASWGQTDFLLPGDAEAETLRQYNLPPVEVMVVPHHGSAGAVSAPLLKALQPACAVVSVGERNSFGHPHADTMALLTQYVGTVLRTDQVGWVSFTTENEGVRVATERRLAW